MAAPDPTTTRTQEIGGTIAFATAALVLAALAGSLVWVSFAGPFAPPPPPPPPAPAARAATPPPPARPVRRRPPEQARPLHDAVRAGYQAGRYREEDVLGAIHALYHEFGTEEARTLAADLEKMIGTGGSP